MANSSYVQTNFQGGEWSEAFHGRLDDKDYKNALEICLNYIPNQEGSLTPRSGMLRLGMTHQNSVARLLPFRFSMMEPYVAEFTKVTTHVGNLRFWANGIPVVTNEHAALRSVTGTPPVFTIRDSRSAVNLVPPEWNTGDSLYIRAENITAMKAAPYLFGRLYTLNIVSRSAGTITLTDAETGTPLSAAITLSTDDLTFTHIKDVATVYEYPEGVRQVQNTVQTVTGVPGGTLSVSPPDHRVTYLYPLARPYSLSADGGVQRGLIPENFIDGPYLDSFGTTIPMTVTAKTGSITVTLYGWDANVYYMKGDLANDMTNVLYYLSLTDNNKGNALPADVDANWLLMPVNENQYSNSQTFQTGQMTTVSPNSLTVVGQQISFVDGSAKIYYSKADANTGNNPITTTLKWGTTPPTWDALVSYVKTAFVTFSGNRYLAIDTPILGTDPVTDTVNWMIAPDVATAVDTFTNTRTGWLSSPIFHADDAGGNQVFASLHLGNPGRLIRLKAGPQPYNPKTTYIIGDKVNVGDVIYRSLTVANLGNDPSTDTTNWEVEPTTIKWTWGEITYAGDHYLQATVLLKGDDLPDTHPVFEFRFGAYSDTTGWPTCGAYHEGRLWLGGAIPNRIDGGVPNQGFNFAPTAPDGTVADANAISYTLNCEENEAICGFAPLTEGLVLLTSEGEWLVSASALNDPLTPTSAQARRTTAFAALPIEVTRLPTGLAAVQRGGRRVLEYRNFIDMSSYQSRLNTTDLSRKCQHLTTSGVGMTQFQSLSQPILWCAPAQYLIAEFQPLTHTFCTVTQTPPVITSGGVPVITGSTLFGIAYSRSPDVAYYAPFSFEHGRTLATNYQQVINSIAIQRGPQETSEYLHACVTGSDQKSHVEMMMPLFETAPLNDVLTDPTTVASFGTWSTSCFLDSAVQPKGCEIAADGLSVTFYGLMPHAGQTVSFTIRGKYVGDFAVSSTGTVNIPFSVSPAALFTLNDCYLAMRDSINYNSLPSGADDGKRPSPNETGRGSYYQIFLFSDLSTSTILSPFSFLGYFGYKYRRRGKTLRPQSGGQNGPAFAKLGRNHKMGVYVGATHEVKIGTNFSNLKTLPLTLGGALDTTPVGESGLTTGIFRDSVNSPLDFDGQLCWEQTDPWPGTIIAVGGFDSTADV